MKPIILYQPSKTVFGGGVFRQLQDECREKGFRRILILYASPLKNQAEGIEKIRTLSAKCGIPQKLTETGIDASETENLADLAMKVTRLLVNNPREVKREDAIHIYHALM